MIKGLDNKLVISLLHKKSLKQELYKKFKERKSYDYENHYQGIAVSISGSMKTNKFWDKINKSKGNHTNYL